MTQEPLITICITNYNSSAFVINTLYCLSRLTKNEYRVIIRDNNSQMSDYVTLVAAIVSFNNVHIYRADGFNLTGAVAHGTALNDMVQNIKTSYGVILDADCTFLIKDWDNILINRLNDQVKIIGTAAPAGSVKPQDFPLMFAILFEMETFNKLRIDFRPSGKDEIQDTGWELRDKYLKAGYRGENIEMKNTRTYQAGPFRHVICAEYYLDSDYQHVFASHFSRGSSGGAGKYLNQHTSLFVRGIYWLPVIGEMLLKNKCLEEKREWLAVCQKIVNEQ